MRALSAALAALLATSSALPLVAAGAQDTTKTTPDTLPTAPPPQPAPSLPFDFSGVLFLNYQYGGVKGNRTVNRFELERAYLNFRGSAGEHITFRVTPDVYQQRDTTRDQYYRGWTLRMKYAYAQYDFVRGLGTELKAGLRFGMLQTPIIEYEEQYWQRGLAQTATEPAGFFQSADLGAATFITLPNKMGEAYLGILNGSGYSSRETDRFKDFAARLALTPFANTFGFFKGFTIAPWYYKGQKASDFARKRGTVGPIPDARQKDRYGVFVAIKDPRITLGAHFARKVEDSERADTTRDLVPTVTTVTGNLISIYTIVKPLTYIAASPAWPIAVVLRADQFKPNVDTDPYQRFYIAGLQWALNNKTTVTFDYQNQVPQKGSAAPDQKVYFVHAIVNFP
jgi:hypothetical protein